jgi:hypothetical protein
VWPGPARPGPAQHVPVRRCAAGSPVWGEARRGSGGLGPAPQPPFFGPIGPGSRVTAGDGPPRVAQVRRARGGRRAGPGGRRPSREPAPVRVTGRARRAAGESGLGPSRRAGRIRVAAAARGRSPLPAPPGPGQRRRAREAAWYLRARVRRARDVTRRDAAAYLRARRARNAHATMMPGHHGGAVPVTATRPGGNAANRRSEPES